MTRLQPLDFLRAVYAEGNGLSTSQKSMLAAMMMGADNDTGRVRRSLTRVGRMADLDRNYVSKLLDDPAVAPYLARVDRRHRVVDVWLKQPDADSVRKGGGQILEDSVSNRCGPSPLVDADSVRTICPLPSSTHARSPFARAPERDDDHEEREQRAASAARVSAVFAEAERRMASDGECSAVDTDGRARSAPPSPLTISA